MKKNQTTFITSLVSVITLGSSLAAWAACGPANPAIQHTEGAGDPYVKNGECQCRQAVIQQGGCQKTDSSGCYVGQAQATYFLYNPGGQPGDDGSASGCYCSNVPLTGTYNVGYPGSSSLCPSGG